MDWGYGHSRTDRTALLNAYSNFKEKYVHPRLAQQAHPQVRAAAQWALEAARRTRRLGAAPSVADTRFSTEQHACPAAPRGKHLRRAGLGHVTRRADVFVSQVFTLHATATPLLG